MFFNASSRFNLAREKEFIPDIQEVPCEEIVSEQVEHDGRVVNVQVCKSYLMSERYGSMPAVSFCLDNQIASGNIVNLHNVTLFAQDNDSIAKELDKFSTYLNEEFKVS